MAEENRHTVANRNNSIDLNDIYNLNRCLGGQCVSNVIPAPFPALTYEEFINSRPPYTDPQRNQALQTATNETPFSNSSPIMGDIDEMYKPITREESEEYPTPAVVNQEIEEDERRNNAITDRSGITSDLLIPTEVTRESIQYLNGFIKTQIGRRVTIDFLIGSDNLQSKTGYLLAVAQNYLLLNEMDTNDVTACDLYTMKFIRFYY